MRTLLIAEAANPEWTSVPLEGWSHAYALTHTVDAHVVTQIRNQEAFERAGWREGKEFTAINSERVGRPLWRISKVLPGNWTTKMAVNAFSYYYFERLVWKKFGSRIENGEFDIVHRLTPLSPTVPSTLAARCHKAGTPFMLGPLNGGAPWPKNFDKVRRREREWLSYVRDAYKLLPAFHATRRCASAIIVGSGFTWDQMPEAYRDKCVYVPENAIDPARFTLTVDRPIELPLRIIFVGRLVPYKGADMLMEAAAPLVKAGKIVLDIVGDGPEMSRLKGLVGKLDLGSGVKLDGWVEHSKLQERLIQSDIFAFPSIREFGGAVVLEAMALGLVPVVVDYAGPSELVTQDTGYRVPIGRREQIVDRFRKVLAQLTESREGIRPMGKRARDRVMNVFTWEAKARQVAEVYDWVLGRIDDKPGLARRDLGNDSVGTQN